MLFFKLRLFFIFFTVLIASSSLSAEERYLLNPGDILDVSVWNEETLQRQVVILPDGMISFPLAGQLMAAGKTVKQVQDNVTEKLLEYLSDPVVTISVSSVVGNTIHIMGKVNKPGSIVMSQRLDVMQALSLAGGLSPYAAENNIIILRRNGDKQTIYPVQYASLKKGQQLESNILLKSGDVIVIP